MIDWKDYSRYPETAAELIQEKMDSLKEKAPYHDEEWLDGEDYKEYQALKEALWAAERAYDDEHMIL